MTLSFGTFIRFHIEHFVSAEVNSKPRQVVGPGMHRGFSAFPLALVVLVLLLLQERKWENKKNLQSNCWSLSATSPNSRRKPFDPNY